MKKTLFAIPSLLLALCGSAFAAQTWEEQSTETGFAAMASSPVATGGVKIRAVVLPAVRLPAGSPSFFTNTILSGAAVDGVPCFNCVNGAPATALGVPAPFNYIPSGTVQQYNVSWTDLTFKGKCTVYITIASGKTVIQSQNYPVSGITAPGAYDLGFNFAAVTYSGPAMATGKVTCGKTSSSVTARLIFE
ncbi:MAG: hypothetical protein IAI50_00010 [Candidatus Eremiobacteraeota bacterium]|nr:hypothetical protein [Candidatus Eremiobacteraeota bacterium]